MRDLTANLMGDPAATKRRAPTETEMHRNKCGPEIRSRYHTSKWADLAVGRCRDGLTMSGAVSASQWLRKHERKGKIEHQGDGTYRVTRVL